jgi:hypothetical protein
MNLFPAWRDSLTILQPKNFKLFFLVTLKTMVDTFKVWIKYFWWLPLIEFVMPYVWVSIYGVPRFFSNPWLSIAASLLMSMLWFVSILLAARPSVAIKNCAYFRSYIWRIIYIAPVSILMDMVTSYAMGKFFYPYIGTASGMSVSLAAAVFLMGVINWSVKVYIIDYALFVLDTDASIKQVFKSLLYALKMVVYNYPFYIVLYIVHAAIKMGQHVLFQQIEVWYYRATMEPVSIILMVIHYSNVLIFGLLTFFLYCLLINFYIKKLHYQFTLYFGKND